MLLVSCCKRCAAVLLNHLHTKVHAKVLVLPGDTTTMMLYITPECHAVC
jgi:hypothetical protein